jgi:hypothetical protein
MLTHLLADRRKKCLENNMSFAKATVFLATGTAKEGMSARYFVEAYEKDFPIQIVKDQMRNGCTAFVKKRRFDTIEQVKMPTSIGRLFEVRTGTQVGHFAPRHPQCHQSSALHHSERYECTLGVRLP